VIKSLILLLLIPLAARAENQCLDIFSSQTKPLSELAEFGIDIRETPRSINGAGEGIVSGLGVASGIDPRTDEWVIVSSVTYRVVGNTLLIDRFTALPDYIGQGVYRTIINDILDKHLGVTEASLNLTGAYFKEYMNDLRFLGDPRKAIEQNRVYQIYAGLGFNTITSLFELDNTQQVYLRLRLSKPFQ